MGRKKIDTEKKNKPLTILIPQNLYIQLEEKELKNRSKLFQWLLEEYFNKINK